MNPDDDFTVLDHAWAAERTARGCATLLIQPDPYTGLQPSHLADVRDWAGLPDAAGGTTEAA
ncbi:hypothetical protein [Streptomyces sp. NPDC051000]|uniref:hypothetical protein n=1 Tax=Streptomyces sp. NPDC051000 TaxID=3155520 RepID=UPI0034017743